MATFWQVVISATACLLIAPLGWAKDRVDIVGSSTVYPFSVLVAEYVGRETVHKTPKVEATGSGGGFKLFCAGLEEATPDIVNSSRKVKLSEIRRCEENGVSEIFEFKFGYGGIVFANSIKAKRASLSFRQIYLALAKMVPSADDEKTLVANPYAIWSDISPSLPDTKIRVLGPPPTSGTRDAFVEIGMEGGCRTFPWIKALKKSDDRKYREICHTIREDRVYVEAGENDNLIVHKLFSAPNAFGIFGFSFLEVNLDYVQGSIIDGVEPTLENIAGGAYRLSRSLYFYVKKARLNTTPGLTEYIREFTSDRAVGDEGYLVYKGLVPLRQEERAASRLTVKEDRLLEVVLP